MLTTLRTVSDLHRHFHLPGPRHPQVSVIDLGQVPQGEMPAPAGPVRYDFYSVCIKIGYQGRIRYGQTFHDFSAGMMSFFGCGQVLEHTAHAEPVEGLWLVLDPEFLRGHALGQAIRRYNFFSYAVHEALHLSEAEQDQIKGIFGSIAAELALPIDAFSQDVLIAQIELLLTYANRYYSRQFITRRQDGNKLLARLDTLLDTYLDTDRQGEGGLPTVQALAYQLNVSPHYLSDMLREQTGLNTQQHIHERLINEAKNLLSGSSLSVSEIAYKLGFGHAPSFSKMFKSKTDLSPLEYRASIN